MIKKKSAIQECIDYLDGLPQIPEIRMRKQVLKVLRAAERAARTTSQTLSQKLRNNKNKGH